MQQEFSGSGNGRAWAGSVQYLVMCSCEQFMSWGYPPAGAQEDGKHLPIETQVEDGTWIRGLPP